MKVAKRGLFRVQTVRLNSAFLEILVSGDDVDGLGAIMRGIPKYVER